MTNLRQWVQTNRTDIIGVAALFVTALAIRLYFHQFYLVISADGVGYANIARSLFQPGGLASASHYPPFYPFLMALLDLVVNDVELSGRIVSMVMGSFLVIPLYLLGTHFFSRRVGALACILAITWGVLRNWSGEVMTQGTYITLLFTALYLLARGAAKRSTVAAVAAGVAMGLSYLTRPEAFIVFAVATPFVVASIRTDGGSWKDALRIPLVGWAAFWIAAFPYVLLLHNVTGTWQLTAKTGPTLWVGLGQYLGKFDVYRQPDFQAIGFMDVIRDYPGFIPYNVKNNLDQIAREMLPSYLWVLAAVGFLSGGWNRRSIIDRFILLAPFAPLLVIIVFFLAGPEYTQLSLLPLLLWIGAGVVAVEGWLSRLVLPALQPILQKNLLSILFIGGLSLYSLMQQVPKDRAKPYTFEQDEGRYDHKRIGLLLKNSLPPNGLLMTRSGRISFYCGHPTADIPQADLATILSQARQKKVRYLVVDGMLPRQRPQMEPLFLPLFTGPDKVFFSGAQASYLPFPGVSLYLLFKDPSSLGVAVYEVTS